uniref:Uncharacterized protein n=1 Tax=Anopheles coluzzii TaxID=1518534 RepID=A0A8W7P032_ANOCL
MLCRYAAGANIAYAARNSTRPQLFAHCLVRCITSSLGRREYLNDYQLKQDLVRKLPPTNQLQWFRFVGARTLFHATLDHLSEFLRLIALDISELEPYRPKPSKRNGGGKKKSNRNGNGN